MDNRGRRGRGEERKDKVIEGLKRFEKEIKFFYPFWSTHMIILLEKVKMVACRAGKYFVYIIIGVCVVCVT